MRKIIFVLLTTAALLICGAARADYPKRLAELTAELEKITTFPKSERDKVLKLYAGYLETRNTTFKALVLIAANQAEGKQAEHWRATVEKIAHKLSEVAKEISNIATHSLFPEFMASYRKFFIDEMSFIQHLGKAGYGERRDQIVAMRLNIKKAKDEAEDKWRRNLELDAPFDEKSKQVADEIKYQIATLIGELAEKNKSFREYVAIAVDKTNIAKPVTDLLTGPLGKLGEQVDLSANRLLQTQKLIDERVRLYQSLERSEQDGVVAMFSDTYLSTKKFIDDNGFDKAKNLYAAADSENRIVYENGSEGQRADAKLFHEQAMQGLSANVRLVEDEFKEFINKHKGKFFGPLAPEIEDQLVETRSWENYRSELTRLNLDDQLRRWRDENAERFLGINLSDAPEITRARIKEFLEAHFKKLDEAIKTLQYFAGNGKITDAFSRKDITQFIRDRTRG